jgi:hypothetical protein
MFLRELEDEVLENITLRLVTARYFKRDSGLLDRLNSLNVSAREGLFRILNSSYCVALSAAHK